MTPFLTILLTGTWILLLLAGSGRILPSVFSADYERDFALSPTILSFVWQPSSPSNFSPFTTPPEQVSIASLLLHGKDYHQRLVTVRGLVTQPELHLDESELFINFVFRLADGEQSVIVFGRHDRTQGAPSISLNLSVEVTGVFWKERDLNESRIFNTIEAFEVVPYPSLIPEKA